MMTPLLAVGRSEIFREMGQGFREKRESFNPSDLLIWVLVGGAVLLLMLIVAKILATHDKDRVCDNPRQLFRDLCKLHGLDRGSRQLLRQLAAAQQLEHPAKLFLEPHRFDVANLKEPLHRHRDALGAIRNRLFQNDQ